MESGEQSPKKTRLFYERVLLLEALGRIRGEAIRRESAADNSNTATRHRRSFADSIAYICAQRSDGDFVTAAALERPRDSVKVKVLIAANENITERVLDFLEQILAEVTLVANHKKHGTAKQEIQDIVDRAEHDVIVFDAPKIQKYYSLIQQKYVAKCLKVMRDKLDTEGAIDSGDAKLADWLEENFPRTPSLTPPLARELPRFVKNCHSLRSSAFFEPLERFVEDGDTYSQDFKELCELLYKLGKHITVNRKIFDAAAHLSCDFAHGFNVESVPSSKSRSLPFTAKTANIERTIERTLQPTDRDKFHERLRSLTSYQKMSEILNKSWRGTTRVHAELLILDHFEQNGCLFLDGNDKYIGCSKPACYLCHAYIQFHPGKYVIPPSHQKLYITWRFPDVTPESMNSIQRRDIQHNVLNKLSAKVQEDLHTEMESEAPLRPFHADSTAGVTSKESHDMQPEKNIERWVYRLAIDDQSGAKYPESTGALSKEDESDNLEGSDDEAGGVKL